MRAPRPLPPAALAAAALALPLGAPIPARAAPPLPAALVGSWTGDDTGEFDEARFAADGSYVFQTQYAGGRLVRSWGTWTATVSPEDQNRFVMVITPLGWVPKRFCAEGGPCKPLEMHPERLPVAVMSATQIDFGGTGDAFSDPDGATTLTRAKPDPALKAGG